MTELYKEEEVTKSYDWKLMKRLLKYAKPYWMLLFISVLLALNSSSINLKSMELI